MFPKSVLEQAQYDAAIGRKNDPNRNAFQRAQDFLRSKLTGKPAPSPSQRTPQQQVEFDAREGKRIQKQQDIKKVTKTGKGLKNTVVTGNPLKNTVVGGAVYAAGSALIPHISREAVRGAHVALGLDTTDYDNLNAGRPVVRNLGGVSYNIATPEGLKGYQAAQKSGAKDSTPPKPAATAQPPENNGGGRSTPSPDGNGSTGTRTSHSPVTMEFVNATMLQRGGLAGKDYKIQNPFASTQLPATSASNYFQENPDVSYSRDLPEDMFSDVDLKLASNVFDSGSGVEFGKNLPQFPASGQIEYLQKDGAPLTVSSGTFKVTETNKSAQEPEINKIPPRPSGARQAEKWDQQYGRMRQPVEREKSELEKGYKPDKARRDAFLDGDLNSMEALRAIEAQKGIVVTGNTYNIVNPNAGQEGKSDFKQIDKAQRDTIMRGGEGAQALLDSYVNGITKATDKADDEEDNK